MGRLLIFVGGLAAGALAMMLWIEEEITKRDLRIRGNELEYRMMSDRIDQLITAPTQEELDTAIAGLYAMIEN